MLFEVPVSPFAGEFFFKSLAKVIGEDLQVLGQCEIILAFGWFR